MQLQSSCSVTDCDNPVCTRGFCKRHYHKWQRYGDPNLGRLLNAGKSCSVDGCNNLAFCRFMCTKHYQQWRKFNLQGLCITVGCEKPSKIDNLCAEHSPRFVRQRKNYRLRRTYGITLDTYNALYNSQKGCCAICGVYRSPWEPTGMIDRNNYLHVDHDHKSGAIRGLLCLHCNQGLGQFKDNQRIVLAALSYLNKF